MHPCLLPALVRTRGAVCAFAEAGVATIPRQKNARCLGTFRGIFVRVRPFENGTMIKGGTPNDEWSRTVPEPKVVAESSVPSPTHRDPPPESVSACMIRMLHHMGNIFRDSVSASGYRGLQLDRKRRKELQEWKIALGHRENDHEDPANYPTQSY